jgi:hypothetical protein
MEPITVRVHAQVAPLPQAGDAEVKGRRRRRRRRRRGDRTAMSL